MYTHRYINTTICTSFIEASSMMRHHIHLASSQISSSGVVKDIFTVPKP